MNSSKLSSIACAAAVSLAAFGCNFTSNDGNDTGAGTQGEEGGTAGGAFRDATIPEIQQGMVPENTLVRVTNAVVTSPLLIEEEGNGVFTIEDPAGGEWSGIYVFTFSDVAANLSVSPGDQVTIIAEYSEFFDFSELTLTNIADLEVTGQAPIPAPVLVNPAEIATGGARAENFESVLVRVEGVTATTASNMFGEFQIDGGLVVDDFFLRGQDATLLPMEGNPFDALQGILIYNFEEFKLVPRTLDDVEGDVPVGTTTGVPGEPVTIPEIQMGSVSVGASITVENVVVTSPLTFNGDGFYVQDPAGGQWSGINVFVRDPAGLSVAVGQQVTLQGSYDEFFELSQIVLEDVGGITDAGMGTLPPAEVVNPADVATGGMLAENYEGVLVTVEGVTVTNPDLMFGEFEVTGGLRVDDVFFDMANWTLPMMGQQYTSITGVLTYSFDNFKIAPRNDADLVTN